MGQEAAVHIAGNVIYCRGRWTLPNLADLERQVEALSWPEGSGVICDASEMTALDTGGAVLLQQSLHAAYRKGPEPRLQGLRPEFAGLIQLVGAQRVGRAAGHAPVRSTLGERLEQAAGYQWECARRGLTFLGESTVALCRVLSHPRSLRLHSLLRMLHIDGVNALPITGLLTFLIGVVIAYQGAEQLRKFGTNIFIVDLVGISLLREIAPLLVAIVIAGRSGSAYAAEIGTMKVTEELDAVRALGISPMNLLVIPRMLALVIALPLLTVYADVLGVFGGMLIASGQLNVSFGEFVSRFEEAVAVRHFLIGIGKAPFFALIIALVGCYQGFQIRGGVSDVGRHTTISVVQSIFLVIVFDAICSIVLNWWHL
ncbi:MlaE family lipid ABC transporter permease subunit [Nitrospira sp. NS4]|uniref:MlaE family lipid ABC transporter permease subunit n=1 Tax=Nitrospira sp. NS4 TaxID=3414498 RepID=UPI003C305CBD